MDTTTIPPMKPVLVDRVSDDINVLQQGDVDKQRTVLTARAIEDVFKAAPIVASNPTDAKYFEDGKVNLDLITEACSRTLATDQYKNGPTISVNSVSGGSEWAVDNNPVAKTLHGMLYVFSILDNGQLAWRNYDGTHSIPDWTGENREVDPRAKSLWIRQVFVPNEFNEYLKFDGTKDHGPTPPITRRTRYDLGVPWTREGKAKFTGSADTTVNESKSYYTKSGNVYTKVVQFSAGDNPMAKNWYEFNGYDWEPWYMQSKVHNGPEYFNNIWLSDPIATIEHPLTDSIYHITNTVSEFILPNANKDGYKVGQKIIIEVHPPATSTITSSCRVTYQDTGSRGENIGAESMQLLITPKVRRNTKDVFGNVRDDVLVTSVATFEIVETTEGSQTFRTWELDAGVEETDFTAGLAQQLGEHTDLCAGDYVQFQNPIYASDSTRHLVIPLTQCGYVVGRFLKQDTLHELSDTNWSARIQVANLDNDACFNHVTTKGDTPDPAQIYYIKEGVTWYLCENQGHPTSFDDRDFYTIDMTHAAYNDVIQILRDGTTTPSPYLKLSDLEWDVMRRFTMFAHRNDLLVIDIKTNSSKKFSEFQGKVLPEVLFYPDPHNSYIQKAAINPGAYTFNQLTKLFQGGDVIDDISLAVGTEVLEGVLNSPASSRALLDGYAYLAHKLQMKGKLFANRRLTDVIGTGLDELVTPGQYFIEPRRPITSANTYPPNMEPTGCNIFVMGNDKAPGTIIHEEEGNIIDPNKVMQIAFIMNKEIPDPADPSKTIVYPMFVESRVGTKQPDGTWKWSAWRDWLNWIDIHDKPLFFHARWDYFEDPDGFINHVDSYENYTIKHNLTSSMCEIVHPIGKAEIAALMEPSDDPEYDPDVNYGEPQFLVGINALTPSKWSTSKRTGEGMCYVVEVTLPDATASQLTKETKDPRRKIKFLLFGKPDKAGWDKVLFRLTYKSSVAGREDYTYERNWGGEAESTLVLEFEQADLPNGDRAWCPIVVG